MKYINSCRFRGSLLMMVTAVCFSTAACAQPLNNKGKFTRQDTLRGTITPERAWWNVQHYNLHVAPDYKSKTLKGWNEIMFTVSGYSRNRKMQIDLQQPMKVDSVVFENKRLAFKRLGNVFYIEFGMRFSNPPRLLPGETASSKKYGVRIYFSGKPREAINPPWDGGWIWKKDTKGNPWMTVACQGLGASVWYPCKDHQGDEPDNGAILAITVPDSLVAVGNGRLISTMQKGNGLTEYQWEVKNPINNYNIVPYIGKYAHFSDSYIGETEK
ncbi:MAG: M1 family peptidase, partial [Chitinophagaceae bacterium]|nr:M1 family peptidase [Chitinophagaceae bacterium]